MGGPTMKPNVRKLNQMQGLLYYSSPFKCHLLFTVTSIALRADESIILLAEWLRCLPVLLQV